MDENWSVTKSPRQGRASEAFVLGREEDEELFAKRVLVLSPDNEADKAYREERILHELNKLAARGLCFNFVSVVMSGPSQGERRSSGSLPSSYMELVMEKAEGGNLKDRKEMSVRQMKELLFQLVYALYVAQREYQFVHYDLHDKNVMVADLEEGQGLRIDTRAHGSFYFDTLLVKIADFALSRIAVGSETIYNTKNATRGGFDPSHDLSNFVDCLKRIVVSDRMEKPEDMTLLKMLKHKMRSSSPEVLLGHEFFKSLQVKPEKVKEWVLTAKDDSAKKQSKSSKALKEI